MMENEEISEEGGVLYNIYAICGLTIITADRVISYNSIIKLILILKEKFRASTIWGLECPKKTFISSGL